MLSGYRLMWLVVMFDLPVIEREERKAATAFRNDLLDMGFEMSQFSVYVRMKSPNTTRWLHATLTTQAPTDSVRNVSVNRIEYH